MKAVTVLSLGAGVQSSALLLMSDRGEIERADFAVFADTQCEPEAVYEWLNFLETQVSIPIMRVTKGDLYDDILHAKRKVSLPYHTKKPDDGMDGMTLRQCTSEYKTDEIYQGVRKSLGYMAKQRVKHKVRMLIGISCDEAIRMKNPAFKWVTNVYPLIDQWKSRDWALKYVEEVTGRTPPRSACIMCPFRSDKEWIRLKQESPSEFQKAVEFDSKIRKLPGLDDELYLHRQRVPLDRVDFSVDQAQPDLFGNECAGVCGV